MSGTSPEPPGRAPHPGHPAHPEELMDTQRRARKRRREPLTVALLWVALPAVAYLMLLLICLAFLGYEALVLFTDILKLMS
jgi:hypothetical protein